MTNKAIVALAAATLGASPALAQMQDMPAMDHAPPPDHDKPATTAGPNMSAMPDHDMSAMPMPMPMTMTTNGPAAGSGTARLPQAEGMMMGPHLRAGGWTVMLHGYAWGTYSNQGGPRGDEKAFVTSMAMAEGSRALSPSTDLQLRAMLSLDPLMGARGYPNLFATGETAGGVPLVDRQHPHDLFMELSARVDTDIDGRRRAFFYGGPVAEPALGPSAFMHRRSARLNPEAPITHHWFDSTHITYGVVTAGVAGPRWQVEASAFRGREPDEQRYDIETPKLDSYSARVTWTPTPNIAASISHGFLKEPEAIHPGENERRTVATLSYADTALAVTGAWSHKQVGHQASNAFLAEANYDLTPRNTLFGRVESVDNSELLETGIAYRVTKATLGYAYSLPVGPFALALGGSGSLYAKPAALDAVYGDAPKSFTLFAKLSLGQ